LGSFVKSINRPGRNATGVSIVSDLLVAKQLDMLRELAPAATSFALLFNPTNPIGQAGLGYAQAAARQLGTQLHVLNASSEAEIDAAFASLARTGAVALVVMPDSFLITRCNQIASLAAGHKIPITSPLRDFADAGALASYGPSLSDTYRLAGIYVGRILKGHKPADLPVQEPNTFELVTSSPRRRSGFPFHRHCLRPLMR
jgi:putative ABC transport system substrate-binding protein